MRLNHLSSRLAAKAGIRQTEALDHTDSIGVALDRTVTTMQRTLFAELRRLPSRDFTAAYRATLLLLNHLPRVLNGVLAEKLKTIATWGHKAAVDPVADILPLPDLQFAALTEDVAREDPNKPGMARFGYPKGKFSAKMLATAKKLKAEARRRAPTLTKDQTRDLYKKMLFPPIPEEVVNRIVFSSAYGPRGWWERIAALTKLASPETIATTVATGYAAGETQQQIAKRLLPLVDGVRSSAKRIARTEGMRITHEVQMQAWDELGEMVMAYQIHAVLDHVTRPEHAARNGTMYFKEPAAGELGIGDMPHPPLEADGSPAFNCRCWLSPVLTPVESIVKDPSLRALFVNAQSKVVPDPATYDQWFSRTDERRRRLAVGSRRYDAILAKMEDGETPQWGDFLHPETGALLPMATLKNENTGDRLERREAVDKLILKRRHLLTQTATFGFLTGEAVSP